MENFQTLHGTGADQSGRAEPASIDERLSRSAEGAARGVGDAVESASSMATAKAKELLQQQLAAGGNVVAHLANTTRLAGDHLHEEVPQLGALVKQAAESIDEIAKGLRERSVDEVLRTAADFGRRQPMVLFGLSAVMAFLAYRLLNEGVDAAS
jgi:hypothetical protein